MGTKSELPVERIAKYIEDSGVSFRRGEVSYIFDCPRCLRKDKLYISRTHGHFICFYCADREDFRGRPEYALAELLSVPIAKVRAAIYGERNHHAGPFFSVDIRDFFGDDEIVEDETQEIPTITFPEDYFPIKHKYAALGRQYLEGRGIHQDIAHHYGVRFSPNRQRVMFPIVLEGRLVGFQERLTIPNQYLSEDESKIIEIPKILSSKGIPRTHVVMFAERLWGCKHAVLCEGPIDAIKAHLCGGNVATMGKVVSEGQLQALRNNGIERLYLALDPDAAEEIGKIAKKFADMEVCQILPPPGRKDLGEMTFAEVKKAFLEAPVLNPSNFFAFITTKKVLL